MENKSCIGINLKFFLRLDHTPCDLYIKLSDNKYVKVLHQDEKMIGDSLRKYLNRNVNQFYLSKDDYRTYASKIITFTANHQQPKKILDIDNSYLNEFSNELGIDKKYTNSTDLITKEVLKQSSENKEVKKLISANLYAKDRFLYDHSYLTAIFSVAIANLNEWNNTFSIKESLCKAAIYHDAELPAQDAYSLEIHSFLEEKNNNHVSKIHDRLSYLPEIKLEVLKIIKNHHNTDAPNLSPLEHIFNTAHQFVIELYAANFDSQRSNEILKKMLEGAEQENYKKQIQNLMSLLKTGDQ